MKILQYIIFGVMGVLIGVLGSLVYIYFFMVEEVEPISYSQVFTGEPVELNKLCRSNGVMWVTTKPCGFITSVGTSRIYEDNSYDLQPTIRIKQLQGSVDG